MINKKEHFDKINSLIDDGYFIKAAEYITNFFLQSNGEIDHYHLAGKLYRNFGKKTEAIKIYKNCLLFYPDDKISKVALASLGVGKVPSRLPDEVVKKIFDENANYYEESMITLGYNSHRKISSVILNELNVRNNDLTVLDLGCGTGFLGELLVKDNLTLHGLDISQNMIELARKKKCYDMLFCAEITKFLRSGGNSYDIIAASNTIIYFGDLEELFACLVSILNKGGTFVFDYESFNGSTYEFHVGGRYSHSSKYVIDALEYNGFIVQSNEEFVMRKEKNINVRANLILAKLQ